MKEKALPEVKSHQRSADADTQEKPARRPLRELLEALPAGERPPAWRLAAARQKHGWVDETPLTPGELQKGLERAVKEEVR
jgi:hypothetical protein